MSHDVGATGSVPKKARPVARSRSALLGAVALGAMTATGVIGGAFPFGPAPAVAQTSPAKPAAVTTAIPSFADVVERVKPAVVSVRVKIGPSQSQVSESAPDQGGGLDLPGFGLPDDHPFQEFFRRFRGQNDNGPRSEGPRSEGPRSGPRQGMAQGSGFFISADGYLVTNNHVIDKNSDVQVLTDDGRTLPAKVVGADPKTDLALLKVDGKDFPFVQLAPEAPRVGDWVLAVGNPFGLGGTVTAGIVSARARDIGAGPYDDFLQIDAPINRGNSGGPAFNQAGQVVGVNTAIASPSGGNVGIAFAIPSETVQAVVAQLKAKGTVERGFLGVQIQPMTKDIAAGVSLDKAEGAIVSKVEEDSPAAKAGIKTGDVVLAVNGKPVKDARDLSRQVASLDPGATATFQVWRGNAKQDVAVKLGSQPGDRTAATATGGDATQMGKLGLSLAPASTVPGTDKKGVAVMQVEPGSPAAEKGFKTGDVIAEVAGHLVETPADVKKAIEDSRKDGKKAVLFRIEAKEGSRFVAVQVPTA